MNQGHSTGQYFDMRKKPKVSKWLWITLIIVAVIGAGFFAYWYFYGPGKKIPVATTTPVETDPTTDWQTYNNTTYGFTLKYPKKWYTDETSDSSIVILSNYDKASQYDKSNSPADLLILGVMLYPNDAQVSDQKYLISAKTIGIVTVYSLRNAEDTSSSQAVYQKVGKFANGDNTFKLWMKSEASTEIMNSEISYFDQMVSTIALSAITSTSTPVTTNSPITYTNGEYSFTMTFPATWKDYKIKTANYEGEVATLYIEMPTSNNSPESPTNDEGYYSPFAITVYTPAQWAAAQAAGGPLGTVITQTDQYVFTWSPANGIAPDDWDKSSDVQDIINSFKTA